MIELECRSDIMPIGTYTLVVSGLKESDCRVSFDFWKSRISINHEKIVGFLSEGDIVQIDFFGQEGCTITKMPKLCATG